MLSGFSGLAGTVSQYPKISAAIFLVTLVVSVAAFSKGNVARSFAALARIGWSIVSTPFEFLRDAISIIRGASEAELDYKTTREFSLFRFSRILYLCMFVSAVLLLSGGLSGSLISFYPKAEIDELAALKQSVSDDHAKLADLNKTIAEASKPAYRDALEAVLRKAQAEADAKRDRFFGTQQPFTGPVVSQVMGATEASAVDAVVDNLQIYMSDCPNGMSWNNFTTQTCDDFRKFIVGLAKSKKEVIAAEDAALTAQEAVRQADSVVADGTQKVADLKAALVALDGQIKSSPMTTGSWIGPHVAASLMLALGTVVWVIALVWGGAISLDVLSWVILLMRSLEFSASAKMAHSKGEYEA